MDTFEFVSIAKSTDKTRPNLCDIYRDRYQFVASDGHRLHISTPQTEAVPSYVTGLDAEFPDYKQIMPKDPIVKGIAIMLDSGHIATLKGLLKLAESLDKKCPSVKMIITKKTITFKLEAVRIKVSASVELNCFSPMDVPESNYTINLKYLMDVLVPASKITAKVLINYYGESSPWMFEVERLGTAIIMPVRKTDC